MSAPPETITPSELWVALTQMPRPHRLVDFPRKDPVTGAAVGQIAIWVLTQEESMVCQTAAERFVRKTLADSTKAGDAKLGDMSSSAGYNDLYRNAASVEILFRACRRPDNLKFAAFPSPNELRRTLSHDEVGVLMAHYNSTQAEIGPYVLEMTPDELESWTRRLEEGGAQHFLDYLASEAKNALIMHLASRLSSFSTASGSSGAQPGAPSIAPGDPFLTLDDPGLVDVAAGESAHGD